MFVYLLILPLIKNTYVIYALKYTYVYVYLINDITFFVILIKQWWQLPSLLAGLGNSVSCY